MSIRDLMIQKYLKETYVEEYSNAEGESDGIISPVPYEIIQDGSIYKVGDKHFKFDPVKEDEIYSFTISDEEEEKEIGTCYKIENDVWVARAKDIPDVEVTGKDKIDCAIKLCITIGEL